MSVRPLRRPRSARDRPQPHPRGRHGPRRPRDRSGSSLWRFCGHRAVHRREVVRLHLHARSGSSSALATLRTLAAFAVAAVGALILGFVLAIGRLSDHAWVRVPVTRRHRGLPRHPGAGLHDPAVLRPPGDRHQDAAVLGRRDRAHRLQRLGARRGHPRGRRVAPARSARSGLRDRPAQERRDAPDPAAAGDPRHDARHHRPARRHAEGHRARLHHHLPRAAVLRAAPRLARAARLAAHPRGARRRRDLHRAVSRRCRTSRTRSRSACGARRRSSRSRRRSRRARRPTPS